MAGLCQPCAALGLERVQFDTPPFLPEGRYQSIVRKGSVRELQQTRSSCKLCGLIWAGLERDNGALLWRGQEDQTWNLMWSQNTNDYQPTGDVEDVEDRFPSALYPSFDNQGIAGGCNIQLIDREYSQDFLRGRPVQEDVHVPTLTAWISRCVQMHGDDCSSRLLRRSSLTDALHSSLTVIDVHDQCLCQLPDGSSYTALSYVWGDRNDPVTLLETRSTFTRKHGLAIKLPQTIRDAIEVTRALGYLYLWVDSLCITQDDPATKMELIANMDAIYSNAHVTLVAATGTGAHSGLSGWSKKTERNQHCVELEEGLRLGIVPYYQRELLECDHATRAWTYQETCLSPRCMVFLSGYVYFNCGAAVYSEHLNADVDGIEAEASANTLGKTERMGSCLQHYSQYVTSYTSRQLKYDTDGLNAFRGISNALAPSMGVAYFSNGMPASCFDYAILWNGQDSLRRRPDFPSWSWVGWKGQIAAPISISDKYDQSWLLNGTWVNWYRLDEGGKCVPIWHPTKADTILSDGEQIGLQGDLTRNFPVSLSSIARFQDDDDDDDDKARSNTGSESDECSGAGSSGGDEGFFPTYGLPAQGNPFGRSISSEAAAPFDRSAGAFEGLRLRLNSHDHSRMICFSAFCITLSASMCHHTSSTSGDRTTLELRDRRGVVIGILFVHDGRYWTSDGSCLVYLALISVTTYGNLYSYHADGYTSLIYESCGVTKSLEGYVETLPDDIDQFDFINVLFMANTGLKVGADVGTENPPELAIYERAGLGFVYREALRDINTTWTDVIMV